MKLVNAAADGLLHVTVTEQDVVDFGRMAKAKGGMPDFLLDWADTFVGGDRDEWTFLLNGSQVEALEQLLPEDTTTYPELHVQVAALKQAWGPAQ